MSENFVPWDSARFIKNEEEARAYLDACMEEDPGDGALIRHALGVIARARGMSGLADATGLSREGLNKALGPDGNPSFATVMKVATALGLRFAVRAEQA